MKWPSAYGIVPVTEPIRIVAGIPADHGDEGIHHKTNQKEDLEYRHVKLRRSKPAHSEAIQNTVT